MKTASMGNRLVVLAAVALIGASVFACFRIGGLASDDSRYSVDIRIGDTPLVIAGDRAEHPLEDLDERANPIDLTVRLCSEDIVLPHDDDFFLVARSGDGEVWRESPLDQEPETTEVDFDTANVYIPDGCIAFNHRGPQTRSELFFEWPLHRFDDDLDTDTLQVHIHGRRPLGPLDSGVVGAFLLVAFILLAAGQRTTIADRPAPWNGLQATGVLTTFLLSGVVFGVLVPEQPVFGFLAMLAVTLSYVGIAFAIGAKHNPKSPLAALAFHRISASKLFVSVAVGFGAAVVAVSLLTLAPKGESEMTRLIEPSAGLLKITALALMAPWAEEFLLRGVIYGALDKKAGPFVAVIGSAAVFSILHLGQHIGSLGPWLVVTVTGLILSGVRWYTGSTVGSTISHLMYNVLLIIPAMLYG